MRINEITQKELTDFLKKSKEGEWTKFPPSGVNLPARIRNWLEQNGFKFLGEGFFSSSYIHKTGKYVVKINSQEPDPAWLAYAIFCMTHKNPHFLKVYALKKFSDDGHTFFVALIERLYRAKVSWAMIQALREFSDYIHHEDLQREFDEGDLESYKSLVSIEKRYPSLIAAMRMIDKGVLIKHPRFNWDLVTGNIMKRIDGTIVFLDPIS